MKNLIINPKIKDRLEEFEIPVNDGVNYLLGVYFDSIASTYSLKLKKQIGITKIFTGSSKELEWNIPLLVEETRIEGRSWILDEYREAFKDVRPDRAGPSKDVRNRMLKFMYKHPTISGEEIMTATHAYLQSLSDPTYVTSAHYFIVKGTGSNRVSLLEQWLEKVQEDDSYYNEDNQTEDIQ